MCIEDHRRLCTGHVMTRECRSHVFFFWFFKWHGAWSEIHSTRYGARHKLRTATCTLSIQHKLSQAVLKLDLARKAHS